MFLKGGWAYVPAREQSSIVFQEFQNHLEKSLEVRRINVVLSLSSDLFFFSFFFLQIQVTAKALPRLDEDTRLDPILANLSQGFLAGASSEWADGSKSVDGITADMVEDLSRKHFPMCMRNLQDNLKQKRHLKHFGRLQYGLFLKVSSHDVLDCHILNATTLYLSRLLAFRWMKRSYFGGELSVASQTINSTKITNITFGIRMDWKASEPIIPPGGLSSSKFYLCKGLLKYLR